MTEYEQNAVNKALRVYQRDFGRLVANALAQFPKKLEPEILNQLQNLSDVYSSAYPTALPVMRTNFDTAATADPLPDFLSITPPP